MRIHPLLSVLALIVAVNSCILAKAETIKGIVVDNNNAPIEGAAVVALQLPDSTLVIGTVTGNDGTFSFDTRIALSQILLKAEALGYVRRFQQPKPFEVNKIQLDNQDINLGEVVVKPKSVIVSPGRFAFSLGDLAKYKHEAFEAIALVPMLNVNKFSDKIEVVGAEKTTIYINGKQSYMSQEAIIQMLHVADPGRIKRVEVWTNPGVEYRDEGAIVNIVMTPQKGITGRGFASVDNTESRFQPKAGFWLGAEWDRWQMSADISLEPYSEQLQKNDYNYVAYDPTSEQKEITFSRNIQSESLRTNHSYYASFGANADLHHNNSIGVNVFVRPDYYDVKTKKQYNYNLAEKNERIDTHETYPYTWVIANVNYDQSLDQQGSSIWARATYSHYSYFDKVEFNPESSLYGRKNLNISHSIQMKGGWRKVFSSNSSLSLGFDCFYDYLNNWMKESKTSFITDNMALTDDFTQKSGNADLFASYSHMFNNLFSFNVGLTGRYYNRNIDQTIGDLKYRFDDWYLMPDISASFNFNDNNLLSVSYQKSVAQPLYSFLNPLRFVFSPTGVTQGNPELKAVTVNMANINYLLFQKISLRTSYKRLSDCSDWVTLPNGENGTFQTAENLGTENLLSAEIRYTDTFFSQRLFVSAIAKYNYFNCDYNLLNDITPITGQHGSYGQFSLMSELTIGRSRDWDLLLILSHDTPQHTLLINSRSNTDFGFGFTKRFSWGGNLRVYGFNLLNQQLYRNHFDCETFSQSRIEHTVSRVFTVNFSYKFGKNIRMRNIHNDADFSSR